LSSLEQKTLPLETFPGLKNPQNAFAAGALPRNPLGSSQRSPDSLIRGRRRERGWVNEGEEDKEEKGRERESDDGFAMRRR